ncbi:MAG: DUF4261 domain-containing protein [Polyangiaceae bacterium]
MTENAFARTYGVELLYPQKPSIDKLRLLEAVQRHCAGAKLLDPNPSSGLLGLVHADHPVQLADGAVPAQTFIAVADKPLRPELLEPVLQQTWEFPEARGAVTAAAWSVLVTDMMSSALPYKERLSLFESCLRGVLDAAPCSAIHWRESGRIVDPEAWQRDFDSGDAAERFFAGAVNVRLFKMQDGASDDVMLMDTLGLGALGLPDLQCHFHGFDPGQVARVLYNTAWYVFEQGPVLEDGHTLDGVGRGSKFRCQHELSLARPERMVIDLDPGPAHAAGKRAT